VSGDDSGGLKNTKTLRLDLRTVTLTFQTTPGGLKLAVNGSQSTSAFTRTVIASRLDPTDAEAARTDALTLFGLMLGTLRLARALTDRDLSDQLLARSVETAMRLLNDPA
jgi:hypothetical protein